MFSLAVSAAVRGSRNVLTFAWQKGFSTLPLPCSRRPSMTRQLCSSAGAHFLQGRVAHGAPTVTVAGLGNRSPLFSRRLIGRQPLPGRGTLGRLQTSSAAPAPASPAPPASREPRDRILTVPNLLCMGRIAATPFLANFIATGQFEAALALFVVAGLSDLADGAIARRFPGQASMFGSFLDPLADKILVAVSFLSLTYANIIPLPLTALVVSRDALLIYAGFYIRYMAIEPPVTLKKYFDVQSPVAQVQPTTISKYNTGVQLVLVASSLVAPLVGLQNHPLFYGLCGVTACTTIASAVSYAFVKDTYKFSHRKYDHQTSKKLLALAVFVLFNVGFINYFPMKHNIGEDT